MGNYPLYDVLIAVVLTVAVASVIVRFGFECIDNYLGLNEDYFVPDTIPEEGECLCRYCEGGDHDCWCSYVEMDDE